MAPAAANELGDQTASQLLRHMEQLGALFSTCYFSQSLPANVSMVLVSLAQTSSLKELPEHADKVMEASSCPITISCAKPPVHSELSNIHPSNVHVSNIHPLNVHP